jgi:hypothetical protein
VARRILAAFVTAILSIAPGSAVMPTCVSARPRSMPPIALLQRCVRNYLVTLILALLGLSLFASVALLRARRVADRIETDARDEIGALQAESIASKRCFFRAQILVTWAAAEQPEVLATPH